MLAATVLPPGCEDVEVDVVVADRTSATAIVSPSARPSPSMLAPMTPGRLKGRTAVRIISQRVAPSASAASWWARGTCRKTSRLIAG